MHDGSLKTLEEVVEWYNKGGHPNKHLSDKIKKLDLKDQEKKDLMTAILAEVTYKPDKIKIALFDHFVEESFVNQSSDGALELSDWLRWQDSNLRHGG